MGFIKRGLGQWQVYKPATPGVDGVQPQNILPKVANDTAAEILGDLHDLFKYAHQVFTDLMVLSSATSQRIGNLTLRVDNCQQYVPQAENYLASLPSSTFQTTARTAWTADALQTAQLLTKASRDVALQDLYSQNNPPPDFTGLDGFAEDRIPCIKKYTNPDFFIDEWLEQQKREREKLMERREKRHNARKPKPEQQRKKSVREVEVGKLKKTRYDEFGNKIEDDSVASPSGSSISTISRGPMQPLSARVAVSTMDASDKSLQAPTLRPRGPHLSISPAMTLSPAHPGQPSTPGGYLSGSMTPTRVTPPAPLSTPGMSTLRSFTPPPMSVVPTGQPPSPPPPVLPTATPPPPPIDVSIPKPPVVPVGAPAPPPPGPPPPGPPPPGPPPPGPPPPGPPPPTDTTPASGIQDARSSLLGQITAGLKLKKVEAVEREPKPVDNSGAAIDVAAILQRRVALEYSDDESESDNDDWDDDDGDFDD